MTEFGAAASSSSSSFTYGWSYHVFLSFRGEDTRQGFTGHLYNALHKRGIRTFLDDEGIRKGEDITPTLLKAIEESKTAIVVFSKNYASSTFCLTELVQILNCMKGRNGRFIWPVFYDVDPSDIRHQTGSYKDAFDRHERVKDEKIVKDWRLALTEAANMSGWHFELEPRSKSYEYEMMEEIIGVVSKEISTGPLHIVQFSVGLESRVKEVCSLLNKQPHFDGATMVGICGIGGIGKTTIVRAVYNTIAGQFQYSCFLSNIKEKSIQDLQEILLSETIGEKDIKLNYDKRGIPIIQDRLQNKKVLLILDDIDTLDQLRALAGESNWFGFGSTIIITTRDRSLLKNHEVERLYEVKELTCEEARQLLILNAFKNKEANPGYAKVIQRAVEYASGLPLVLEILGSNFHICQTIEEWETALDIYEKIPDKTVQKILKVSYDGLGEKQREIFLDIACFYRGQPLEDAIKILSASHDIGVEFCIRELIEKSLIKIGDDSYLDMHDLIQDMGQEIVRQESPIDVGRRSRLWSSKDILHVLKENTGTATIQAILTHGIKFNFHYEKVEWSGKAFKKMKNLRVLRLSRGIKFSQGPKCLPNSLRVVEWDYYPWSTLPDNFCPINLVILRLTYSRLKTLGKACKNFYNLHELDLSCSENLEEFSDISEAVNLEKLNVSYCPNLTKIDDSVGRLDKLRVLKAEKCERLNTFIVGGLMLVSLEILDLNGCCKLCTFPEILVTMEKIEILDLSHTAIEILPKSIEKLALERLWLSNYKNSFHLDLKTLYLDGYKQLRKIPSNIEVSCAKNCESLTSISIRALSKQIFYNLRKLNICGCANLEELPNISELVSLEELNVSYCEKLTKIDDSVGHLAKLRVLNAERCKRLDTFIVGGITLVSLEILNLKNCYKLHTFSEILVTMEKIEMLDLSHTAIKILPESIEKLVALERLWLSNCEDFPRLDLKIKTLYLNGCKQLREIRKIPPNIEVFSAEHCESLTSNSIWALLKHKFYNLRQLNLSFGENLEEVSDVSEAVNLEKLNVSYCKKLTKIDNSVGHLAKLRVLNAEGCERLDTFIVGGIKLVSLEILNVKGCYKLHTFPKILVIMENIRTLDLSHTAIKILPESIEKLVALEALYLNSCKELRQLPNLACHNLKTLNLDRCKELEEIRGIPPNIEVFFARNCTSLTFHSIRPLLIQELHENGNTQFILPGKEIPKWFHKYSTEGSVSFWVRKKFPQIALCAILKNGSLVTSYIRILINGKPRFVVRDVILQQIDFEIGTDHIFLFDPRKQGRDFKIGTDLLEEELNHVVVSLEDIDSGFNRRVVECIGLYVYNYDSCREDILFENPSPQSRTPVEVLRQICNSDLESSSVYYNERRDFGDRIEEDDKLNKEIIDLSTERVSNIKKKGQLMVDDVNLTLSLALPEPSNDTTSHHDLQQQQHLSCVNQQILDCSENVQKGGNIFEVTWDAIEIHGESTLIDEGHDGRGSSYYKDEKLNKDIMDLSTETVSNIEKKKGQLKVDNVNLTLSLALPEPSSDTTSYHDDKSKNQIMGPSTEVVSSARKKEINLNVDAVDGPSFSTTSETMRDLLLSDLQRQQHLFDINQQVSKSSEIFKKAKGKNIIVYGDNASEEKDSNTLEKDQSAMNDEGHDETESHKTRVTCFDLFSYLVSLCSSSAAS